jgi:hypothetical protein
VSSPIETVCVHTRGLFPAYLEDSLTREERSGVRSHLASCAACRSAAASTDPAFVFTVLASEPAMEAVSAADAAKILAGVRAGIALKAAEKRIRPDSRPSRLSWKRPAMTAAAAVAAVLIAWKLAPRPAPAPETTAASARVAPPASPSLRPASLVPAEGSLPGGLEPVKAKSPADATIYDWNPGGGQPRVVWIVDRSLDI